MNNQATIEKMNQMKLYGRAHTFSDTMDTRMSKDYTADEMVAHLIDSEWEERSNRRLNRLIKLASVVSQKYIDIVVVFSQELNRLLLSIQKDEN
jgi:hypothetical protein